MTLSYLAVSVLAVVVVEVLAIGVVLPQLFGEQDLVSHVQVAALRLAKDVTAANTAAATGGLALPADYQIGDAGAPAKPDTVQYSGDTVEIPIFKDPNLSPNSAFAMVVDINGRVIASTWPSRVAVGSDARSFVPRDSLAVVDGRTGVERGSQPVIWSTDLLYPSKEGMLKTGKPSPVGWVYVQVPNALPFGFKEALVGSALESGLLLLLVSVPLAVVVGMLTTRGLIARLDRLGAAGGRLGQGALEQRVDEGPADELGRLERRFNLMAASLESARAEERRAIDEQARMSERARIARDLHDAVSQELFSLGMAAGGMEKALPEGPLRERARAMRETAESGMQEMSELLLALRPSVLEEGGLVPALERLCGSYQSRLGVAVMTRLEDVGIDGPGEVALLRLAQEGLSNAVRHSEAGSIEVILSEIDGRAVLTIKDDGRGFDPAAGNGHGLGLQLMRDRVAELGGGVVVTSSPGMGTVVEAWLPLPQ